MIFFFFQLAISLEKIANTFSTAYDMANVYAFWWHIMLTKIEQQQKYS